MADPLTIALMGMGAATAAPSAGMALLALGTGLTMAGQVQAGRYARAEAESAQDIANYNAAIQEQEARAIEQKTVFEQQRQVKEAERAKGRLRARLAASGARIDVGAPLLIAEEQAAELELESFLIGYEGRTAIQRARTQAQIDLAQGKIFGERGKAARATSYIGAGRTLLTGFGEVARTRRKTEA